MSLERHAHLLGRAAPVRGPATERRARQVHAGRGLGVGLESVLGVGQLLVQELLFRSLGEMPTKCAPVGVSTKRAEAMTEARWKRHRGEIDTKGDAFLAAVVAAAALLRIPKPAASGMRIIEIFVIAAKRSDNQREQSSFACEGREESKSK